MKFEFRRRTTNDMRMVLFDCIFFNSNQLCTSDYFRTEDDRNQDEIFRMIRGASNDDVSDDEDGPIDDTEKDAMLAFIKQVWKTNFRKTSALSLTHFSTSENLQ